MFLTGTCDQRFNKAIDIQLSFISMKNICKTERNNHRTIKESIIYNKTYLSKSVIRIHFDNL